MLTFQLMRSYAADRALFTCIRFYGIKKSRLSHRRGDRGKKDTCTLYVSFDLYCLSALYHMQLIHLLSNSLPHSPLIFLLSPLFPNHLFSCSFNLLSPFLIVISLFLLPSFHTNSHISRFPFMHYISFHLPLSPFLL